MKVYELLLLQHHGFIDLSSKMTHDHQSIKAIFNFQTIMNFTHKY